MKCSQQSIQVVSTQSQGTIAQTSRTNRAHYCQLKEILAISKSRQDLKVVLLNRHIIVSQPVHLEIKIWTKNQRRSTTKANVSRKSHLKIFHLCHRNVQRMEAFLLKQSIKTCPHLWNRTTKLTATRCFQISLNMAIQNRTKKPP